MNYNLIISSILLLLIILKIYNKIDMSMHIIIVISITTVLLMLKINSKEHLSSDDVLRNLGSVYNTQNMTVGNLTVTGKLTVGDPATNNVKMTVNDPAVNSGNTVDINKCSVLTRDVNVSNILTSANTANLNTLNVSDGSNLKTVNVSEKITTNNLDVTGTAQQISTTSAFPPKAFFKHRDEIKLVLAGTVNGPASRSWGQGWEMGISGLGGLSLLDGLIGSPIDSFSKHFKIFNPTPDGKPHPSLSGLKFELTKL
jgi:hypothetical protein